MCAPINDHVHVLPDTSPGEIGFLRNLFESFTPRRVCMNFEPDVIWLHVFSDLFIALAYFSIPIALVYFVRRRRDLQFNWMFLMFAAFIFSCGTTHIFGILDIWNPLYRIDGLVKAGTALVSVATAVLLWQLIPKALAIPSPGQLRDANALLEQEIEERKAAQQTLRESKDQLEVRVQERTRELNETNQALQAEIRERQKGEKEREELLQRERAARAEAQNANRVKDEFMATLSHELRTPLNAILGWSHVLTRGTVDAATLEQGLGTIQRSVRAQTRLIEDLLDMSRILAGKVRLDTQRLSPHSVVGAAIEAVRPAAEAKGVRLQSVPDPDAGPITGDANRLQQIVWNLLSNAIKFTPRGGLVQVFLKQVNSHVELTVSDTGMGIKPEFLPYIFERFQQADSSTTRRFGGLGLGLSIVKHLVELHGGSVRAMSEGEGKGATFVVTLPLVVTAVSESAEPERFHPVESCTTFKYTPPSLKGVRVLVIDDEPDSIELIRHILAERLAEVDIARSAHEGLATFQRARHDVVICDIGMPELDGYGLIQKIRELEAKSNGKVPAIALTAFARSEDRLRAFSAGFQVHLAKPVEPDELVAVVASLVRPGAEPTQ